ncbi:hypothetical protein [Paenibacillus sp. sgz500958]|uniref:hypothetical protein n=1 Tax=Paenibacillus sp. sgz500958 TaxID=3242475 RepID=UPI0036D34D6F
MKITITGRGLRKNEVLFTCKYGEGKGIWCGANVAAQEEYEVEFELPVLLMRWIDILPADSGENRICREADGTVFTGRLDNIEEDGTGFLGMDNEFIMFESLGEPMALGTFVSLKAAEVQIYPVSN